MNINELTLGQIKEIMSLMLNETRTNNIFSDVVGEYVIVRSRNEGINAGYVAQADETGIILLESRRIWYHKPKEKNLSWYEGVAVSGLSDDSKISCAVEKKVIAENYSITLCSEKGKKSIIEHPTHEQC